MKRLGIICLGIAAISLGLSFGASTQTDADYSITSETVDSAGANAQSSSYVVRASAAGEFGVASTASITSATYLLESGYVARLRDALAPTRVVSRKVQGTQSFDIDLPLVNSPGIECRSGGLNNNYEIVVSFLSAVTLDHADFTSGNGSISTVTGSGTATVTIDLAGITNQQTITITLVGVNDGSNTYNVAIPMAVLVGDTNGNGTVNSSDVSQTKAQSGQPITTANFREDVTASGIINSSDVSLVKAQSGTSFLQNLPVRAQIRAKH